MREYRLIRRWITCFLAVYFVGGMLTLLLPGMEVFPVFSWFLFAKVPDSRQYGLLILDVNGQPVEPPRLYQEADGLVSSPHSVTVFKLTQKMGAAAEKNHVDDSDAREMLERNWLPSHTRYELVKLNADPVTRWKTGRYQITQKLGTYTNTGSNLGRIQ